MKQLRAPHLAEAIRYAEETEADSGIEELQRLAARRFLDDLRSGRWDLRPGLAEFVIETMTGLFCFSQGERLDGTPLRGKPFELMPWHTFTIYNTCAFFLPGTQIRRFTEADLFAPRKTVKTTFGEGLRALVPEKRRQGEDGRRIPEAGHGGLRLADLQLQGSRLSC